MRCICKKNYALGKASQRRAAYDHNLQIVYTLYHLQLTLAQVCESLWQYTLVQGEFVIVDYGLSQCVYLWRDSFTWLLIACV